LNIEHFQPLLELSVVLNECNAELQGKPGWKRKAELKKVIENAERKLTKQSAELINRTVDAWESEASLSAFLVEELNTLKEASDESWHDAIEGVKERLSKLADKESSKSPARRKIDKNGWWITIFVIGITVVSLKWHWLINVTESADTPSGIAQRAAALEKILDYDDLMGAGVRRGSWLKGLLFWPAKPTEEETRYAAEFMWTAIDVYDYLQKENALCDVNLYSEKDKKIRKYEIAIAQIAVDYINNTQNFSTAESGSLLLTSAYISKFPCQ